MKKLIGLSLLSACAALPLYAVEDPSFDFIEIGHSELENADGIAWRSNISLGDHWFINLRHEELSDPTTSLGDLDTNQSIYGFGYRVDVGAGVSTYLSFNAVDLEVEQTGFDDDGYQITYGSRIQVSNDFQLYGELSHINMDELSTRTETRLGLRQMWSDSFGGFFEYKVSDNGADGIELGVNFSF